MSRNERFRPIILGLLLALIGCEGRTLEVESNTSWSGAISGRSAASYDGSGNERFEIRGGGILCWTFQKDTPQGYLRAYMKTPGIFGVGKRGFAETSAQYGLVSGCSDQ